MTAFVDMPLGFFGEWEPGGPCALAAQPERYGAEQAPPRSGVLHGYLVSRSGAPLRLEDVWGKWRRVGPRALEDVHGDFALALWDAERRSGLLAHDRMGARSLYLAATGRRLLCATELRLLLPALHVRPAPDHVSVVHWLGRHALPAGHTMFDGIRRLQAGEAVELGPDTWRCTTVWIPGAENTGHASVRETLHDAVRRRLGDGQHGVLLSGGLDSSSVAVVARRERDKDPRLYSAVFPNMPSADESAYIRAAAEALAAPLTELIWTRGAAVEAGLVFLDTWQEPCPVPNFGLWRPLLRRAGDDGTDVMLDGEGGDELFGPAFYLIADKLRTGRVVAAVTLARTLAEGRAWLPFLHHLGVKGAAPWRLHGAARRVTGRRVAPSFLRAESARLYEATYDPWEWKREGTERWQQHLTWMLVRQRDEVGVLQYFQRAGGEAGVELRHPLLDPVLVDLVLSLAPDSGFGRTSRPLLQEAVAGLLPDEVRLRRGKSALTEPVNATLAQWDLPALEALLSPGAELEAFVPRTAIHHLLAQRPSPSRWASDFNWPTRIWRWAMAEAWLREQGAPGAAAKLAREIVDVPKTQNVIQSRCLEHRD